MFVGTIDCTLVKINKPKDFGNEYINSKGYASINVQATCNAKEVFTSVDVSWPGSVHDSRVRRAPEIQTTISWNGVNVLLLADSGYAMAAADHMGQWHWVEKKRSLTDRARNKRSTAIT
uniref:DDE Tnp4 domain-containing protein n=1 Tax=Timema douglasi TaxID=61478 RepID=A0A7R8VHM4_TIMDO|nr:unnamed protein product [Timema douglasi]